jgi:hypothetical protein
MESLSEVTATVPAAHAPASRTAGDAAQPPARGASRRPRRLRRVTSVLCLAVLALPVLWIYGPHPGEHHAQTIARPQQFHILDWEVGKLSHRLPTLVRELVQPPPADTAIASPDQQAAVRAFFSATGRWQRAVAAGASETEVADLRAAWQATLPPAEQAIAQSLAALAVREGLTTSFAGGERLLPPPSFLITEPPRVLIVSPRDRVEVAQSVLLRPGLPRADAEALEEQIDTDREVSLVIAIGGIATYPAIVPPYSSPAEMLSAVAHEWVHGYLFFMPLGRAYFGSYDSRTLNESVADLAGRELGAALAEAYGFPASRATRGEASAPAAGAFDFRGEMRATRARLDELLSAGQIPEAERYLEDRRQAFAAAGFPLRKLNQAYFAFFGSYGDSPAAVSPLDGRLRVLRAGSSGLSAFLRRVGQMTTAAEVQAALPTADTPM